MKLLGINNVLFTVGDMTAAIAFYQKLGFELKYRVDALDVTVMAIGKERQNLLLRKEEITGSLPTARGARLFVEVPDARAAVEELKELGLSTVGGPLKLPAGWLIQVPDPWGNIIGLADHQILPEYGRLKKPAKAGKTKKVKRVKK